MLSGNATSIYAWFTVYNQFSQAPAISIPSNDGACYCKGYGNVIAISVY